MNGITSGKSIRRPTTGWMYKTLVNNGEKQKNYQNPQLVGPHQISGCHQQEIHPNFQLPSMELMLMATRNPVRENQLFPLFMTDFIHPTNHQQYGRGPGRWFPREKSSAAELSEAAEAFLAQHVAKAEGTKALETLCRFGREVWGRGGTAFFHGFLKRQDGAPKNQLQMGLNLSLEVRFLHPSESDLAFGHLEGMFHPIETNC